MTPTAPDLVRLASDLLREGRSIELVMRGTSMRPLIEPGTRVRVDPASAADVQLGEVVLLDIGGRHICHRLMYRDADQVITRGDTNRDDDPPMPPDAIVGRVPTAHSPLAILCAVRALLR